MTQINAGKYEEKYEGKHGGKQKYRRLEELNLIDDFLFQAMISNGEKGEQVCRILLETILGKPIGKVHVTAQKVLLGADTDMHGIRMDAYAETDGDMEVDAEAEIYDIEPDNTRESGVLPWRTRLYQAMIDSRQLGSGLNYRELKNVYIIMILPYDPFGKNRMLYTVKNQCVEDKDVAYEDGARKLFLYTKGTEGNPSQELQDMLKYIENSVTENASNASIRELHRYVEEIRQNKEVGVQYMKTWEREAMIKEEGRTEGRAEGRVEGRIEGETTGETRINTLILKLSADGRTEEIVRAASDREYQEKLLKEYQIV